MKQSEVYKLIEQHYRKNFRPLVVRHSWYFGNIAQAEDVIQEAYTRACQYWAAYDERQDFGAWLQGIIDNCKKDSKRQEVLHGMSDDKHEDNGAPPVAVPKVILNEVIKLIDSKSEEVKRALHLVFLHQYTTRETATKMGVEHRKITSIVWRFREEVKKEFQWAL